MDLYLARRCFTLYDKMWWDLLQHTKCIRQKILKLAHRPSCCKDDPSFTRFSKMPEALCRTLSMWCSRCVHTNSSTLSTTETSRVCTAVINRLRDRRRRARLTPKTSLQSAVVLYSNKYTIRKSIHSITLNYSSTYLRCEDCCNVLQVHCIKKNKEESKEEEKREK